MSLWQTATHTEYLEEMRFETIAKQNVKKPRGLAIFAGHNGYEEVMGLTHDGKMWCRKKKIFAYTGFIYAVLW